jgi:hypothetical protein
LLVLESHGGEKHLLPIPITSIAIVAPCESVVCGLVFTTGPVVAASGAGPNVDVAASVGVGMGDSLCRGPVDVAEVISVVEGWNG